MISPSRFPLSRILPPLLTLTLFLFFLRLYGAMAAPELDWGDAGEAQLAAWTAGLSHPTGYPLFLMLGWLWSHALAPLGIAPTRAITLLSATAGAATVALLLPTVLSLFQRAALRLQTGWALLFACATAIFFGLSPTFWDQALRAEVYTLHILLLALLLWGLWRTPRWPMPWLALLYGIGLSHHRTMILWAPALLLWLWLEEREAWQPRRLLSLIALVALPQLSYLYIVWRGPHTPYLHQPLTPRQTLTLYDGSPRAFLEHITGTVFAADLGLQQPFIERVASVWQLAEANLFSLLPIFLLPALLLGLFPRRRGEQRVGLPPSDGLLLVGGALATLLFGLFYAIGDVEVMFLPVWLVAALLMAVGAGRLLYATATWPAPMGRWAAASARLLVGLMLVVTPLGQLGRAPESRADHDAPRRLVTEILNADIPPNAILVTNDRNEMVPLWYAQFAEGQRPDLLGLFPLITPAPEHRTVVEIVAWALQWERPVLLTKPMPGLSLRYDLAPHDSPLVIVHGPARLPSTPVVQPTLAPALTLTGWEPPADLLTPGEETTISVALLPTAPLTQPLSFSLQLFTPDGAPVAQRDIPPDPFFPSDTWPPGEALRLLLPITLPPDAPPGPYQWRLSAYVLSPDGTFQGVGQQVLLGEW